MKKYLFILLFAILSTFILTGCQRDENRVSIKEQLRDAKTEKLYFSGVDYVVPHQENFIKKRKYAKPIIKREEVVEQGMEGIIKTGWAYVFYDLGARMEFDNYYSPLFDKKYKGDLYHKDNPYSIIIGSTEVQVFGKNSNVSLKDAIQRDHKPLVKISSLSKPDKVQYALSGEKSLEIIDVYPLENSPFFNTPIRITFFMDKNNSDRYYIMTNVDTSNDNINHFSLVN